MGSPHRITTIVTSTTTASDVIDALGRAASPRERQACMHPDCRARCSWTGAKGRPVMFCSSRCRRSFASERESLLDEISLLRHVKRDSGSATFAQRRQLEQAISLRLWTLRRYPRLDDTSA